MKILIISAILIATSFSVCANYKTDSSSLSQLLTLYYEVKNALVNSDAVAASTKAGELYKAIENMDEKKLSKKEDDAFKSLHYKLSYDARHISEVKELPHQREHFANLSLNMYTLAKAVNLSDQPVYEQYCPMKDAYWLSNEKAIKNPYYGNNMLTCGEVKDTLKSK